MNQHLNIACFAVDGCLRQTEDFIVVKDALMTRIWNEDESAMKHSLKKFVLYVALNLRQGAKTRYIVQTLANKLHTEKNMLPLTVLLNLAKRITVTKRYGNFSTTDNSNKKSAPDLWRGTRDARRSTTDQGATLAPILSQ